MFILALVIVAANIYAKALPVVQIATH